MRKRKLYIEVENMQTIFEKYKDKLDWEYLSQNPALTPAFIEKYKHKWDLGVLSENLVLPLTFIEANKDKLDWSWDLARNPA